MALALASCLLPAAAQDNRVQEYQLKAVFLSRFPSFVTWPDNAFADASTPIAIGILGDDPFGGYLREAIKGEAINGRALVIRRCRNAQDAADCQIVFLAIGDEAKLAEALAALADKPVLTVGEHSAFTRLGGVIGFVLFDNRIHLEISTSAATRAQLTIGAKLMSIATVVK